MIKKRILFLSLLILNPMFCVAALSVKTPNTKLPNIKLPTPVVDTLPNGLQIVWFLNDRLPLVDIAMVVKAGYRDDAGGKSGTAELVSNLLDRGSGQLNAAQIARSIEILGASRSIVADDDNLTVGIHGLASDAPELIELIGKMLLQPRFPEAELKREQSRFIDRWSHIKDYSDTLATLVLHRILTAGTSYGRGNLASAKEVRNIERKDILQFYQKYFTPKNSILMIGGKVDPVLFKKKILSVFGSWKGDVPSHEYGIYRDPRLSFKKGDIILVDRPDLSQSQIRMGFSAPLIQSPDHYPLTVANALLGGEFQNRLNPLLQDSPGLTYSISSAFSYNKNNSEFMLSASTQNTNAGLFIQKVIEVLKNLKEEDGISQKEVDSAKEYLEGSYPLASASIGGIASRWMGGYVLGLGAEHLNDFIPQVHQVTLKDVQNAIAKHFDLGRLVIVVAGDTQSIKKSLKEAGFLSIKQVSALDLQ